MTHLILKASLVLNLTSKMNEHIYFLNRSLNMGHLHFYIRKPNPKSRGILPECASLGPSEVTQKSGS